MGREAIYLFGVWCVLIVVSAAIAWAIRFEDTSSDTSQTADLPTDET